LAITQPRLECCTIRTVVPTGGKLTWPLLGWASAESVSLGTALGDLVSAFADDAGDGDAAEDEDEPVLAAEEAVLWVAVPDAAPVVEVVELDDPPHAVSSSTSEPSPAATVHPLLRITCLSLQKDPGSGSHGVMPGVSQWT
jgi:hypothetical protein